MSNMLDYLLWRGDLSLKKAAFNDIDALILSRMVYTKFDNIVPNGYLSGIITIQEAIKQVLAKTPASDHEDHKLLQLLIKSPRFSGLHLCAYTSHFDPVAEEQFCAMTVLLPDETAIALFRGTDATLVGWKENFNTVFLPEVPSQRSAVQYLERLGNFYGGYLRLAGHSKGGNLAMYASVFANALTRRRIIRVCNFDGPGFREEALLQPGFAEMQSRITTYLPQSSIIGLLFEQAEQFTIIKSDNLSIFQHNLYSWQILGKEFIREPALTRESLAFDSAMKHFLTQMPQEQREKLINSVYQILENAGIKTIGQLGELKNLTAIFRAAKNLEPETQKALYESFRFLQKRTGINKNSPA